MACSSSIVFPLVKEILSEELFYTFDCEVEIESAFEEGCMADA